MTVEEIDYQPTEEMIEGGRDVMRRFAPDDYDKMAFTSFRTMLQLAKLDARARQQLIAFLQSP